MQEKAQKLLAEKHVQTVKTRNLRISHVGFSGLSTDTKTKQSIIDAKVQHKYTSLKIDTQSAQQRESMIRAFRPSATDMRKPSSSPTCSPEPSPRAVRVLCVL
jgi:hypothetical protein